jgi:hypothetical protein
MTNLSQFCPICDYGELIKQVPEFDMYHLICDCCNFKIKENNLQLNTNAILKDNLN